MKIKNNYKLMPLCALFALTACSGLSTSEFEFMGEKAEITLPSDQYGYIKRVKRIAKELEAYADPSYVSKVLKDNLTNDFENSQLNKIRLYREYDLYQMIYKLVYYERGYLPYDNGIRDLWKKVINDGRSDFNDEERETFSTLYQYLQDPKFDFYQTETYGYIEYKKGYNLSFDLRPVLGSYALEKVRDFLGNNSFGKRTSEYFFKSTPNDMYVGPRSGETTNININGPYGKPITINGLSDAYINVTSCVDSKVKVDDRYASLKFIDLNGPWVENDAVISVTMYPGGNYGMSPAVFAPAYAFRKIKTNLEYWEPKYEEEEHIFSIVFKNGEITYCSSYLDVKYEGASYGKYRTTI